MGKGEIVSRWLVVSRLAELDSRIFTADDLIEHPAEASEIRHGIARMRQTGEVVMHFYDPRNHISAVYRLDHIDPPRELDKRPVEDKMYEAIQMITGEFTCAAIGIHPSTIRALHKRGIVEPVATMKRNGVVVPHSPGVGGRTVWRRV